MTSQLHSRHKFGSLRYGDVVLFGFLSVCSSVCLFVRLSPVQFVKKFATWQHITATGRFVSSPIYLFNQHYYTVSQKNEPTSTNKL